MTTSSKLPFLLLNSKSLRGMADSVNRYVTTWWRTEYSDVADGAFSLHDYVLGTDMVRVALESNLRRAKARDLEVVEERDDWTERGKIEEPSAEMKHDKRVEEEVEMLMALEEREQKDLEVVLEIIQ